MHFLGAAGETHREDRDAGERRVMLPSVERDRREQVVVADDDVGDMSVHRRQGLVEPDDTQRPQPDAAEPGAEMIAEEAMSANAEGGEWGGHGGEKNLIRPLRDDRARNVTAVTLPRAARPRASCSAVRRAGTGFPRPAWTRPAACRRAASRARARSEAPVRYLPAAAPVVAASAW